MASSCRPTTPPRRCRVSRRLISRLDPRVIIALGDSFHDNDGARRLSPRDAAWLAALQAGREWVWIAGNHDPARHMLGGMHAETLVIGRLLFRHQPMPGATPGEIAGHLHPAAIVAASGSRVRRRCFAADGHRLVLPAFGAYAGGLNVLDRAFAGLFARSTFRAFMLGEDRVYAVGPRALRPD